MLTVGREKVLTMPRENHLTEAREILLTAQGKKCLTLAPVAEDALDHVHTARPAQKPNIVHEQLEAAALLHGYHPVVCIFPPFIWWL